MKLTNALLAFLGSATADTLDQGTLYWRVRLSTVELLVKITCIVIKKIIFFQLKNQLIWTSMCKEVKCTSLSNSVRIPCGSAAADTLDRGTLYWRVRLSTIYLLVKITCFVKKKIIFFQLNKLIWTSLCKEVNCTYPSCSARIPCWFSYCWYLGSGNSSGKGFLQLTSLLR